MLMSIKLTKLRNKQEGFAALVIAIVIVLVLSLLTVGFAQLMRTEQRNALDKQLSAQAYYAAESGINDAMKAINAGYNVPKKECGNTNLDRSTPALSVAADFLKDNVVGTGSNTAASYPCLLINPDPKDLEFGSVDSFTPTVSEFFATDGTDPVPVTKIVISWQDSGTNTTFLPAGDGVCGNGKFTPAGLGAGRWSYTGVLNAQITPVMSNGDISRSNLINKSINTYLCPNSSAGFASVDYSTHLGANNGEIVAGNCSSGAPAGKYFCTATIDGFSTLPDQTTFFVSLRSIYSKVKVNVTAYNGSTQLVLKGAQTVIDSTGKAQDVLKRIQVRVPAGNTYDLPPGTAGGLLCKQVEAIPTDSPNKCQP